MVPERYAENGQEDVIPDDLADGLLSLVLMFNRDEEFVRYKQIRAWKKLEEYWKGNQNIYWSLVAHDWKNIDPEDADYDPDLEDKIVNIYKAHGESIIAALSVGIPQTRYYPDDADNDDDIFAAQMFTRAAELIQKHNAAPVLFMKMLWILFNQGMVAVYNYNKADKKYGTFKKPIIAPGVKTTTNYYCPDCGSLLNTEENSAVQDEAPPQEAVPSEIPNLQVSPQPVNCPTCSAQVTPYVESNEEPTELLQGYDDLPKTRECLEAYGPLHVKIPAFLEKFDDTPYLQFEQEIHIAQAQALFPQIAKKIATAHSDLEEWERWGRLSSEYYGSEPLSICTIRKVWYRPWSFNYLGIDNERADQLKQMFPDGCRATFVNDVLAEVVEEDLDDHWSITTHPMSNNIHSNPIGASLAPVQEMTNRLKNLKVQTVEYGIPETFADSEVLDFDKYSKEEIRPGLVTPVKPSPGKSIGDSFFTIKTSALGREATELGEELTGDAQFVSGAFPSIYGGIDANSGRTAAEYSMSRAQALQRLQITWTILNTLWSEMEGKAVKSFLNNLATDESNPQKQGNNYINAWIRKTELTGKIGMIEPESSDQFPVSWNQQRDMINQFITMNNEFINEALFHPENRTLIRDLSGIKDLFVPGDLDRKKQLAEISELIKSDQPPTTSQLGLEIPVVLPEDEIDDHTVHIETIKSWCNGEIGQLTKKENPSGYGQVVAHLKLHLMAAALMAMNTPAESAMPDQNAVEEPQAAPQGEEA